MSSRFAAAICGHLIRRQTEQGVTRRHRRDRNIRGPLLHRVGVRAWRRGEYALGIDLFDWPNDGVLGATARAIASGTGWRASASPPGRRTAANMHDRRVARQACATGRRASSISTANTITQMPARTISSSRMRCCIRPASSRSTTCCIPAYPTLIMAVFDYLKRHPEMRGAVHRRPREHLRRGEVPDLPRRSPYRSTNKTLMDTFARFHFIVGSDVMGRLTLVSVEQRSPTSTSAGTPERQFAPYAALPAVFTCACAKPAARA